MSVVSDNQYSLYAACGQDIHKASAGYSDEISKTSVCHLWLSYWQKSCGMSTWQVPSWHSVFCTYAMPDLRVFADSTFGIQLVVNNFTVHVQQHDHGWAYILRFHDHKWHNYVNMDLSFDNCLSLKSWVLLLCCEWVSDCCAYTLIPRHCYVHSLYLYIGSMASDIPVQSYIDDHTGYSLSWVMNHTVHFWMILG